MRSIFDANVSKVSYGGNQQFYESFCIKGAGRVAFSNQQSYIAAISARFVQLQHGDIDKRVSCVILLCFVIYVSLT